MRYFLESPDPDSGPLRRGVRILGAMIVLPLLVSCGNLTAGGASEVETVVASDESSGSSSADEATSALYGMPAAIDSRSLSIAPLDLLDGTVRVALDLELLDSEGDAVAVLGGTREVMIDLAPGARQTVETTSVPSGVYSGFRATFTRAEAQVVSAPTGGAFPGLVEVDLDAGPVVVEREFPIELADDARIRLVVDLRAGAWVLAPGTLPPGPFRNAVQLTVEST